MHRYIVSPDINYITSKLALFFINLNTCHKVSFGHWANESGWGPYSFKFDNLYNDRLHTEIKMSIWRITMAILKVNKGQGDARASFLGFSIAFGKSGQNCGSDRLNSAIQCCQLCLEATRVLWKYLSWQFSKASADF